MRWLHPIGDVRAWIRWRESILIAEEDRIIRMKPRARRRP